MSILQGKKAWRQLHKNAASNIEQVLEAAPHKAAVVRPLTTITKTIKVSGTRHAGYCWRSRDEPISDVLLWTPLHGRAKAARTFTHQLCADTGCSQEYLPRAMDDREGWLEIIRDIRTDSATWWWWWWFIVVLQIFMLSVLFLVNVINLYLLFFMLSLYLRINALTRFHFLNHVHVFLCEMLLFNRFKRPYIELFFFLFLFTGYFRSVDPHIVCLCHLSEERPCGLSLVFLTSGSLVEVLPLSISRIVSFKEDSPGVYLFDEVSVAKFGLE